jgi:cardiolipin synthase
MQTSCKQILINDVAKTGIWVSLRSFFVFHLLRRYPAWFGWLPAHAPRLTSAEKLLAEAGGDHVNEGQVS